MFVNSPHPPCVPKDPSSRPALDKMSDSWRRATAVPFSYPQQHSPMHVVIPHNYSYMPPSPPLENISLNESNARRALHEATVQHYEDARRAYQHSVGRERAEIDKATFESTALSHTVTELKMKLSAAESRAAKAETDRDKAQAGITVDTVVLRKEHAVMSSELRQLREDNAILTHTKNVSSVERMQLESLVTNLRAELQAMGQTVVNQTSTIRALSTEMSRRDPYHLVKHQREQQQQQQAEQQQAPPPPQKNDTSALDELQKKLTAVTSERDKAFGDVKKLETELTTQRAVAEKAATAAQATFQADLAALNSKSLVAISEKDVAEKKLAKLEDDLGKVKFDLNAAQILVRQLTPAPTPMKAAPTKSIEVERAEWEAGRTTYENRILELVKDTNLLKESNAILTTGADKLSNQLASVKKQAEKDRKEVKLVAESALNAIALMESGKIAAMTVDRGMAR